MYSGPDRRLDPRTDARILVDVLSSPKDPHVLETLNLSSSGALCRSTRFLPLNSMVRCRLHLPAGDGVPARAIETDAIVLRVNSGDEENRFHVTLYFVDMAARDREWLRRFVFTALREGADSHVEPLPVARKA